MKIYKTAGGYNIIKYGKHHDIFIHDNDERIYYFSLFEFLFELPGNSGIVCGDIESIKALPVYNLDIKAVKLISKFLKKSNFETFKQIPTKLI